MTAQAAEGVAVVQALDARLDMAKGPAPALHMLANARVCFIPYCPSSPHCSSKARTFTDVGETSELINSLGSNCLQLQQR
jgi:hypothetical protein